MFKALPNVKPTTCIIGIDPGNNSLGLCTMIVDSFTLDIINISTLIISPDKYRYNNDTVFRSFGGNIAELHSLYKNLCDIYTFIKPDVVVCEAPFMNRIRPTAYGPLVSLLSVITRATISYNNSITFDKFPPLVIKKIIGATKDKSDLTQKEKVLKAILNIPEIVNKSEVEVTRLSHDEVDSIAIAYTHLVKIRRNHENTEIDLGTNPFL